MTTITRISDGEVISEPPAEGFQTYDQLKRQINELTDDRNRERIRRIRLEEKGLPPIALPAAEQPKTWVECLAENERLRVEISRLPDRVLYRTKRLVGELDELRRERDHFLDEIGDLHFEYVEKDCEGCSGSKEVEETILANRPSRMNPMVPAEDTVLVTCEDCLGTGKEWGV